MSKLLEKLKKFFNQSQMSGLEAYINSKKPTNAAEVDHYAREYTQRSYTWGRGL
jgi:hypothetical protein